MAEESRSVLDRRRVPRGGRRATDRSGKYPTVLVAESYDGVRKSCARYLDRFNFQVAEAADGEQALTQIAAEPPQVILAESNLPAMPAGVSRSGFRRAGARGRFRSSCWRATSSLPMGASRRTSEVWSPEYS